MIHAALNKRFAVLAVATASVIAMESAQAQSENFWLYQIRPGDTLIGIAQRVLIDAQSWRDIQNLNAVKQPRNLRPNTSLRIPMEQTKLGAVVAKAIVVSGNVERQSKGIGEKIILKGGDAVHEGDRIFCGPDGGAKLEFVDGSQVQLQRDTTLVLKHLQGQAVARLSDVQMLVEQGRVETNVKPMKTKISRYEVRTPTVQIGVRGTSFRVNFDPSNAVSRSEVLEGMVNARNDQGSENVPKDFGTLIPPNAAPLPPIALLPAPNADSIPAQVDRLPVRLKWESVASASQYRAQLASSEDFSAIVAENVVAGAEAKFGDLADGRYFLRVRAIDDKGLEGKNAQRAIDIKARPIPPFLESPQNKSTARGDKPELRWTQNDDAAKYHVQMAADADFKTLLVDEANSESNKIVAPTAVPPGEYFWRVASKRADGDRGPFSDAQKFTLKAIPMLSDKGASAPAIDDKTLVLAFPEGEPGQKYHFQLARSRQFDPLLKDATLTEPRIAMARPSGRELFMRIQVIDSDGYIAPFGPIQRIELPKQDMKPEWSVEDKLIHLDWKQALPGQRYRVQLARETTFAKLLADVQTAEPNHTVPRPLGERVYLRTQVTDSDGFVAPFSEPISLDLPSQTPALLSPVLRGGTVRFAWSDAGSGQLVRVQVARDRSFKYRALDQAVARQHVDMQGLAGGEYFLRVALADAEGFTAPFGAPMRIVLPSLGEAPGWLSLPLLLVD